jgi:type I site-specific restriction-modification system R (restriction) subunit
MQGVRDKIGLYLGLFRARGWHILQLRKRSLSRLVSSVQAGSTPSSRGLQLVSRAVVSTEIVDIMKAAGLESPDISILSDEFLAEVRNSDKKNFAIEALKKLINGNVRSQSKRNVTQSKMFSERLEAAVARYHTNAITTAEVLEELIRLAKISEPHAPEARRRALATKKSPSTTRWRKMTARGR